MHNIICIITYYIMLKLLILPGFFTSHLDDMTSLDIFKHLLWCACPSTRHNSTDLLQPFKTMTLLLPLNAVNCSRRHAPACT